MLYSRRKKKKKAFTFCTHSQLDVENAVIFQLYSWSLQSRSIFVLSAKMGLLVQAYDYHISLNVNPTPSFSAELSGYEVAQSILALIISLK